MIATLNRPMETWTAFSKSDFSESRVVGSICLAEVRGVVCQIRDLAECRSLLGDDPGRGEEILHEACTATERELDEARALRPDGIYYRLAGANSMETTPMEYGGHFLELERKLIGEAQKLGKTVVAVETADEPYIDFLTDLPADVLAWIDGPSVESVRELAHCHLAHNSAAADFFYQLTDSVTKVNA